MNLKQMDADIKKLKRQMASAMNTTVEGYTRFESSGGVAFGAGERRIAPAYIAPKTVVIIKKPSTSESTLLVREAKYVNIPPKKCTGADPNVCFYDWVYPDFEVYPPLGMEVMDYDGDEWTKQVVDDPTTQIVESGLAVPTIDTVFHRCHREHEVWVMTPTGKASAAIGQFQILDSVNQPDFITGYTWDGTTRGNTIIKIAKPYTLRKTPFHNRGTFAGISYNYTSNIQRIATRTSQSPTTTETQVIVPGYRIFAVIYAAKGIVDFAGEGVPSGVEWLDLNVDGRQWAKVAT